MKHALKQAAKTAAKGAVKLGRAIERQIDKSRQARIASQPYKLAKAKNRIKKISTRYAGERGLQGAIDITTKKGHRVRIGGKAALRTAATIAGQKISGDTTIEIARSNAQRDAQVAASHAQEALAQWNSAIAQQPTNPSVTGTPGNSDSKGSTSSWYTGSAFGG